MTNLINKKKFSKDKINNFNNNMFKTSLFIFASLSLVFISILIIFVVSKGANGFVNAGLDFVDFLFGNYYDGVTYFASGFMIINTLWTSFLALLIALPISIFSALFITRFCPGMLKTFFYSIVIILAGIPSVIYGAFGSNFIDKYISSGLGIATGSVISIVFTLSIMIMPTITLMTITSINNVDKKIETSSLALGATKPQTSFFVTLKAASTGILVGAILGVGRAIGEATAVSMIAAEPYSGPSFGLFEQIRLLTTTMLKGKAEMAPGSINEASMYAMATLLLFTILVVFILMKYVEKHFNNEEIIKKDNKNAYLIKHIKKKIRNSGYESLSSYEKWNYRKIKKKLKKEKRKSEKLRKKTKEHRSYSSFSKTLREFSYLEGEKQKKVKSNFYKSITFLFSLFGILFLLGIIIYLISTGYSSLTWEYLTSTELNQGLLIPLTNTLILIGFTLITLVPIGVFSGIYFAEYSKETKINSILETGIDLLAGIPSLIFGITGFIIFVPLFPTMKVFAASITLTFILLPIIIKTTKNAINSVPKNNKEASLSLGATSAQTSFRVSLPQSMPSIVAGVILSIGRVIGESAALIMIMGSISNVDSGEFIEIGGTTLATEIWRLTSQEIIDWGKVAAIGIVILILIFSLSLIANQVSNKKWINTILLIIIFVVAIGLLYVGDIVIFFGTTVPLIVVFISWLIGNKIYEKGYFEQIKKGLKNE